MTTTSGLNSPTHNLQSTQQALNMLRNLREKRKKQNPATIYELVKDIHGLLKDPNNKKGTQNETLSSEDYLASNRESIEGMLIFIKNKITQGSQFNRKNSTEQKSCDCQKKTTKLLQETFQQSLAKKQEEIQTLNMTIKSSEQQSKTLQIKLLNNIKRLNVLIQQRENQLSEVKKILSSKEAELDEVVKLNEKQHKKIRKMQQDIYDLQLELEEKNQELQAERECADFLQKRVGKFLEIESQAIHEDPQEDKLTESRRSEVIEVEIRPHLIENIMGNEEKSQVGTQTDTTSPMHSPPTSEQNNRQTEQENQDKISQTSSILTESKQSKYIQSIQRLTMQLGEAYQRINELMKDSQSAEQYKNVETITCDNIRLQSQKRMKNMVNVSSEANPKSGKSKSRSGYFSKFWK